MLLEVRAEFYPEGPHSNVPEAAMKYARKDLSDSLNALMNVFGNTCDWKQLLDIALDYESWSATGVLLAAGVVLDDSSNKDERHLKMAAGTKNHTTVQLLVCSCWWARRHGFFHL